MTTIVRWLTVLSLAACLAPPPPASAYDSHCGVGAIECDDGFAAARTRWGVEDNGLEDRRAEHRTIWLLSRDVAGLPANLDDTIRLPVFTNGGGVGGAFRTVEPVASAAVRAEERVTSLAEMAQLPDFSYTLWDWATGNELCPPDAAQDARECHDYFPHIGLLNSSHMLPQAERFYRWYHDLALARAADCRTMHDDLGSDEQRARFEPWVLACETEAMLLEAVGHHFLQDAWSMGHMWERWGGPEVSDFDGDRTLGAAIAAFTGIIHGAKSLLGEGFDDPLCAPHPGVGYIDGRTGAHEPGLGDVFLDDVLLPAAGDADYGRQRRALLGCAVDGMRAVYGATAQRHGEMAEPRAAEIDAGRRVTDASCWGQRATNQALGIGFGLHVGTSPDQVPMLEVAPEEFIDVFGVDQVTGDDGELNNGVLPIGVLVWALSEFAPRVGLPPLDTVTANRFRRDAARAATLAATRGADPETGLLTDLASGGLPPLAGIRPNASFARQVPSTYIDPPLPWGLFEAGPEGERREALALTFADAHATDRCLALTTADLEGYRAAVDVAGTDEARRAAACGQCELMVAPHLRFGVAGNHDVRREALCEFLAPGVASFVFTDEDPASFTGTEPTDRAALERAARTWCGCGDPCDLEFDGSTSLTAVAQLPAFECVRRIRGNLFIGGEIGSFAGLERLEEIDGELTIAPAVATFTGPSHPVRVGSRIRVQGPALQEVTIGALHTGAVEATDAPLLREVVVGDGAYDGITIFELPKLETLSIGSVELGRTFFVDGNGLATDGLAVSIGGVDSARGLQIQENRLRSLSLGSIRLDDGFFLFQNQGLSDLAAIGGNLSVTFVQITDNRGFSDEEAEEAAARVNITSGLEPRISGNSP